MKITNFNLLCPPHFTTIFSFGKYKLYCFLFSLLVRVCVFVWESVKMYAMMCSMLFQLTYIMIIQWIYYFSRWMMHHNWLVPCDLLSFCYPILCNSIWNSVSKWLLFLLISNRTLFLKKSHEILCADKITHRKNGTYSRHIIEILFHISMLTYHWKTQHIPAH